MTRFTEFKNFYVSQSNSCCSPNIDLVTHESYYLARADKSNAWLGPGAAKMCCETYSVVKVELLVGLCATCQVLAYLLTRHGEIAQLRVGAIACDLPFYFTSLSFLSLCLASFLRRNRENGITFFICKPFGKPIANTTDSRIMPVRDASIHLSRLRFCASDRRDAAPSTARLRSWRVSSGESTSHSFFFS